MSAKLPRRLPGVGDLIGDRYELVTPIARGGMAVVWRAGDHKLGRDVAVKLLRTGLLTDPLQASRIQAEAQALAMLTHSNIALVHDAGVTNDELSLPYLVMELIRGRPLSAMADRLSWSMAASVAAHVADGLAAAHAIGLVHRDVSAANVLMTNSSVKLIDFGICAMVGDKDTVDEGHIMGTVTYLAPERLHARPVAPAVDIYSLGVLFYRLLTGRYPWPRRADLSEELNAVFTRHPPRLEPELPLPIRDLCRSCLNSDPLHRPDAGRVAASLRQAGARWDRQLAAALSNQPKTSAPTVLLTGHSAVRGSHAEHPRPHRNQ